MPVLFCLLMLGVFLMAGCSSGGGNKHSYSQDPQFARDMYGEHIACFDHFGKVVGLGEHEASKWQIKVKYCAQQGSDKGLGPWSCDGNCMGANGCSHATAGRAGDHVAIFTYAGLSPVGDTIVHEVIHPLLDQYADNPVEVNQRNGHPEDVHVFGIKYNVRRQLMYRPVRWPALVSPFMVPVYFLGDAVQFTEVDWFEVGCVNGKMEKR